MWFHSSTEVTLSSEKNIFILTFRIIAHWDTLHDNVVLSMQGEEFISVRMASVMCLHCNMLEGNILELTNGKCHLCVHRHAPHNTSEHTHAKCHEVRLMVKLVIINVT